MYILLVFRLHVAIDFHLEYKYRFYIQIIYIGYTYGYFVCRLHRYIIDVVNTYIYIHAYIHTYTSMDLKII